MLTIRRDSDYAARILLHLAMQPPGTCITAREVARQRLIPSGLARSLLTRLAGAGLLVSRRGKGGGFYLARTPGEISLLEVVEAVEGPIALNQCTIEPQECPLMPQCPVHEAWVDARDKLRAHLADMTFEKLAQRGQELQER